MRKLLLTGILLVLCFGCQTKSPIGPGTVTVTQATTSTATTSTTTTTITPVRRYVAFQVPSNLPNDMTLFFQLLSGGSSVSSFFSGFPLRGAQAGNRTLAATNTYTVTGVYGTLSGIGGVVSGQLVGTLESGTFTGTLTAETLGCTAERQFSGQLTSQILQWTAGQFVRTCAGTPLAFTSFTLLGTDAPPPTTTVVSSSSTTSVVSSSSTSSITPTTSVVCMYALSPTSATFPSTGTPPGQGQVGQVHISATAGCSWTVQVDVDWITVQSAFEGSGPATVKYLVADNRGDQRSAALTIAGLSLLVTQF